MSDNLPEKKTLPQEPAALDVLSVEVANLILKGKNKSEISREMGYNRRQIQKLIARPAFDSYLRDIDKQARSTAVTYIRNSVAGIAPTIVKALEGAIKAGNVKGIELALRTIGAMEQPQQGDGGPANLHVYLPGTVAAPTKDEPIDVTAQTETEPRG